MNIKGFIEWVGHDAGSATATIFPYLLVGIVGLYLLWLVIGYLRVSQVGFAAESETLPRALPLPGPSDAEESAAPAPGAGSATALAVAAPRGVPYCPTDQLQFPAGAVICPRCEGDLLVACANCGTTIRAADDSCFHCGTRQFLTSVSSED
jgi:hypothetical protein